MKATYLYLSLALMTLALLTSCGDAPGMNAAIRAVTRAGICNGFKIKVSQIRIMVKN